MSDSILLTGGTGLLGRYLLRDLMESGVSVAVVVRPTRRCSAHERVEAIMQHWEDQLQRSLPRPFVLSGDLTQPDLGLDPTELDWVARNCDAVLHNAASLTFVATSSEAEPYRSNVQGMRHALDLCRKTGIIDFHHVSTAYVAGLRQGRVFETELDIGQSFGNDYEQSKVEAEQMVREAEFLTDPTIFRPAIIVGDSQSGFTTTFHGFYAALRVTYTLTTSMHRDEFGDIGCLPTRLTLTGDESKNLVPVDWVSDVMTHIVNSPQHHGRTYHLAPDEAITTGRICEVLEEIDGFHGTKFVGPDARISDPSEVEQIFYENIRIYDSYWRNDPLFDLTNTKNAAPHLPCPHVDREMLLHLSRVAIDMKFRFKDRAAVLASKDALP